MEHLYSQTNQLDPSASQVSPRRHNIVGIISLVLSSLTAVGMVLTIIGAGVASARGLDETSPVMILIGLLIFACIGADLIAVGLGIAGLFQTGRSKVPAVIGIILGAVTIALVLLLIFIGLAAS
jgi:hypothetical protein